VMKSRYMRLSGGDRVTCTHHKARIYCILSMERLTLCIMWEVDYKQKVGKIGMLIIVRINELANLILIE
jgi:hypothetical protein